MGIMDMSIALKSGAISSKISVEESGDIRFMQRGYDVRGDSISFSPWEIFA